MRNSIWLYGVVVTGALMACGGDPPRDDRGGNPPPDDPPDANLDDEPPLQVNAVGSWVGFEHIDVGLDYAPVWFLCPSGMLDAVDVFGLYTSRRMSSTRPTPPRP